MGQTESLDAPYEETGPNNPAEEISNETQETEGTTEEGGDGLSIGNDENTEEAPQRLEHLPEKFQSVEELAKAYKELEQKLGAPKETPEGELSSQDIQHFSQRYAENGELDDSDYEGLAKLGVSREMAEAHLKGIEALQNQYRQSVFSEVGGEDSYTAMVSWAAESLTKEEVAIYDEAVESGDLNRTVSAVRGLHARYAMEHKSKPTLLKGNTSGSGTSSYASMAEMKRDMANPKYHSDPAFRQQVQQKLAASDIM